MKIMLIDLNNYAGRGMAWDGEDYNVVSDSWDLHCWVPDILNYYHNLGYEIGLFENRDLLEDPIVNIRTITKICDAGGLLYCFIRARLYIVTGHKIDNEWQLRKSIIIDSTPLEVGIRYLNCMSPETFFITSDWGEDQKICESINVDYQNICDIHSVALGLR